MQKPFEWKACYAACSSIKLVSSPRPDPEKMVPWDWIRTSGSLLGASDSGQEVDAAIICLLMQTCVPTEFPAPLAVPQAR